MKAMKTLTIAILMILSSNFCQAYTWLNVHDPLTWGTWNQGTIEEAELTIEPKGVYMEMGLYLTLSAKNTNIDSDSLEIRYSFSLPPHSIVHDSWLWVGDEIVEADILDRWSAYMIYESIVERRQDPSLLVKDWGNNYRLNIYPLESSGDRKVKISYLVPVNFQNNKTSIPIPVDLLSESNVPLNKLKVHIKTNTEWVNPEVISDTMIHVSQGASSYSGFTHYTEIPNHAFDKEVSLTFDSPMKNGIYVSHYKEKGSNEGYYQMAVLPSKLFNINNSKKTLWLFDFERNNTSDIKPIDVFKRLETTILNQSSDNDYFNIMANDKKFNSKAFSWIKSDHHNISKRFADFDTSDIAGNSDLEGLLIDAIDFINKHGNQGEIILLTNSDNYSDMDKANDLLEMIKTMDTPPIHVVDFYNMWHVWECFGGNCYSGNEYLLNGITRMTTGNYIKYNYWNETISSVLNKAVTGTGKYTTSFDIHTSINNGLCHSRYHFNYNNSAVNINSPIIEIGKYYGSFPFKVEMSAVIDDNVISYAKSFTSDISISDTLIEEMWTGNYIEALSDGWTYDNKIINQIVEASINERVLSNYTAFLALEPGMEPDIDPVDPTNGNPGSRVLTNDVASFGGKEFMTTDIDKNEANIADNIKMLASPNPFISETRILINIPEEIDWRNTSIEIFDISGRKLKHFKSSDYIYDGVINIVWNGKGAASQSIPSGVYFVVLNGKDFSKTFKLIKAK